MMFAHCNRMLELFLSVVSCILSGLKTYLAEKYIKQDLQEAKSPLGRAVAGPLL
jgi:predicted acyltransferase